MLTTIPLGIIDSTGLNPYASWSSTNKSSNITLSNNNLTFRGGTVNKFGTGIATIGKSSGKWYWEITINTPAGTALGGLVGACNWIPDSANTKNVWQNLQGAGISNNGTVPCLRLWISGAGPITSGSCITSLVNNDVISFALDMDSPTKSLKIYKNGIQHGITITGLTGTWYPACMSQGTVITAGGTANFGQNAWSTNPTVTSTRNTLFAAGYNQGVYTI
jgi:hypothetical protein